jgi:hypothetical protein
MDHLGHRDDGHKIEISGRSNKEGGRMVKMSAVGCCWAGMTPASFEDFDEPTEEEAKYDANGRHMDDHHHRQDRHHHRVTFENVCVRDYPITLSVNPASRFGPAIELGWDYNDEIIVPIDEYEERRHSQRRSLHRLYLFFPTRIDRLKNLNYTDDEIQAAELEKDVIVRQRDLTVHHLSWSRPLDIFRNEWRAVKRQAAVRKILRNQQNNNKKLQQQQQREYRVPRKV